MTLAPEMEPQPAETAPSLLPATPAALTEPEPAPRAPTPAIASVPAQPAMEPKLVISESARFMARLNQRLTEAEKKLDQKSEQAIERMTARLHELTQAAENIEKERERKSAELGASYKKHLESVVEQIKTRITEASDVARKEFDRFFMEATAEVEAMNEELVSTLRYADHRARSDSEALTETTRKNVDQHIEQKVEEYNTRTDYVCELLDSTTHYYRKQLQERFERFKARMSEELDSIQSSLDRNVRSMSEEIDGSWDRASEKLKSSHEEFEQTANHLVRNCEIDLDREIKRAYVEQILPKILDNKAIFRSMLQDMGRNFEEQSEKIIDEHVHGLEKNIEIAKAELNRVVFKCLTDIETVGQGQRSDLDELFNSTNSRLIQMTDEIETKLAESREDIERNQAACRQLTESSSAEEDSSLSRERTKTKNTLSEVRSKADNTLEEAIGTSCLHLDQLSEQLQKDLNKQRADWTNQVKGSGEEGINAVRKALQDAFQAIEIAREKYME